MVYLPDPKGIDIIKALLAGDIIDDKDGVGTLVVGASDGPEAFLACCVPNLQLHDLSLYSGGPT